MRSRIKAKKLGISRRLYKALPKRLRYDALGRQTWLALRATCSGLIFPPTIIEGFRRRDSMWGNMGSQHSPKRLGLDLCSPGSTDNHVVSVIMANCDAKHYRQYVQALPIWPDKLKLTDRKMRVELAFAPAGVPTFNPKGFTDEDKDAN